MKGKMCICVCVEHFVFLERNMFAYTLTLCFSLKERCTVHQQLCDLSQGCQYTATVCSVHKLFTGIPRNKPDEEYG